MTTPEEIALFIQNSAIREPLPNRFRIDSIKLDGGYYIEPCESETVTFAKEGEEGVEVNVIELRTLSSWFNEICRCPECDDNGGYTVDIGASSRRYACECDGLPLSISIHAKI